MFLAQPGDARRRLGDRLRVVADGGERERELLRDRVYLGLTIGVPLVVMVLIGLGFVLDVKNLPVAVWIHGGGWHRGDKSDVDRKPQAFVDQGFVFISINYRLFPNATIQQIADDVANLFNELLDLIAERNPDFYEVVDGKLETAG